MNKKIFEYFQKRAKENQDFLTGNPEMEVSRKISIYQEMNKELVEAMSEIPAHERSYDLNMLLAKNYIAICRNAEAFDLIKNNEDAGKDDPLWYYYMGFCLDDNTSASNAELALSHYARFMELAAEKTLKDEDRALIGNVKTRINMIKALSGDPLQDISLQGDAKPRLDLNYLLENVQIIDIKDCPNEDRSAYKTLEYFQKKFKENQNFAAGNPEMEIYEKRTRHAEMTRELIKEIQEIPLNKRGYELNMLLVKLCNTVHDAEESFFILWNFRERGKHDPLWYYYMGEWIENYSIVPEWNLCLEYYTNFLKISNKNPINEEDRHLTGRTKSTINTLKVFLESEDEDDNTDFDALVSDSRTADADGLLFFWKEVFRLPKWLFIVKPDSEISESKPFTGEYNGKGWFYVFTDAHHVSEFAAQHGFTNANGSANTIGMEPLEAAKWIAENQESDVFGVRFNDGEHGWYIPVADLLPVYEHVYKYKIATE